MTRLLMLVVLLGAHPLLGSAQTAVDPRSAQFVSPDQYATNPDNSAIIDRYDMVVYQIGTYEPYVVVDIGKPQDDSNGVIHVDLVSTLPGWPLPSGFDYVAQIVAIGPLGSTPSASSNHFSFSGACAYTLSATSGQAAASGGQASIAVTSGASCTWVASSSTPWITLSGAGGTGAQSISYTVASNPGSSSRTGTFTLANNLVTITQAGGVCSFNVTPGAVAFPSAGGSASAAVDSGSSCNWSVASSTAWITLAGASTYTGPQTVGYTIAANTLSSSRTGSFTVAGTVVNVSQAGVSCSPAMSPGATTSFAAAGGNGSASVTAAAGCTWSAQSSTPWLSVSGSGTQFSGSQTVTYTAAPNTAETSRTGTITVAGTAVTISQAAQATTSCSYTVSFGGTSFSAAGGTATTNVNSAAGCAWTMASSTPWMTTSGSSFVGQQSAKYTVAQNPTSVARTATLTVAGRSVQISQAGRACSVAVSLSSTTAPSAGGSLSASITTPDGCSWTIGSPTSWLTVTGSQYTGSQSVSFAVAQNPTGLSRNGSIAVSGRSIGISQAAAACSVTITPGQTTFEAVGGSTQTTITTPRGCAWTASSAVAWIRLNPAQGNDTRTITYTVAANSSRTARTGSLSIAGNSITISQAASQ